MQSDSEQERQERERQRAKERKENAEMLEVKATRRPDAWSVHRERLAELGQVVRDCNQRNGWLK